MQDFEQALFPGMDQSQYRVLWIEHQDKLNEETGERRLELNFLIPNVEILTGQRLQPYYDKADRPRIDLFKKITNYEYQLLMQMTPSIAKPLQRQKTCLKLLMKSRKRLILKQREPLKVD